MTQTLEAIYDGSVLHLDETLQLEANTRVRIVVEPLPEVEVQSDEASRSAKTGKPYSFLDVALSLNLEGFPPDYAENIDHYLYGVEKVQKTARDE